MKWESKEGKKERREKAVEETVLWEKNPVVMRYDTIPKTRRQEGGLLKKKKKDPYGKQITPSCSSLLSLVDRFHPEC